MPNNPIQRFREKFPTRRINRKNAEAYLLSEITLALTRAEEVVKEMTSYIVHEVHDEGGRTTDGQTLFWAKVRKGKNNEALSALSRLKDEYTKQ